MPGSYITFTDGIGSAQLDNGATAIAGGVGSRFVNWVSMNEPIGPTKNALGTGQLVQFKFRTDYTASFEMQDIPNANVTILDRLILFLLSGGIITVVTGDSGSRTYANCCLAPGTKPTKKMFSREDITWTLGLTLLNLDGAPMTCIYTS